MVLHVFKNSAKELKQCSFILRSIFYFVILYFKQCFATAQLVLNLNPVGVEHATSH
jgi:hypothetical protein